MRKINRLAGFKIYSEGATSPSNTFIPAYFVDAVIEVPFGAYPCRIVYEYALGADPLKVERDTDASVMVALGQPAGRQEKRSQRANVS